MKKKGSYAITWHLLLKLTITATYPSQNDSNDLIAVLFSIERYRVLAFSHNGDSGLVYVTPKILYFFLKEKTKRSYKVPISFKGVLLRWHCSCACWLATIKNTICPVNRPFLININVPVWGANLLRHYVYFFCLCCMWLGGVDLIFEARLTWT